MRIPRPGRQRSPHAVKGRVWAGFLLVLLLLSLVTLGFYGYDHFRHDLTQSQEDLERRLTLVARLDAERLKHWREERLADAAMVRATPYVARRALDFLSEPHIKSTEQLFRGWLDWLISTGNYERTVLLDASHQPALVHPPTASAELSQAVLAGAQQATETLKLVVLDTGMVSQGDEPRLCLLVPFVIRAGGDVPAAGLPQRPGDRCAALLVLETLVEPVLSEVTAARALIGPQGDIHLARQEENKVVYLGTEGAPFLTSPATGSPGAPRDLVSAMVLIRETGTCVGTDWRGIPVVAAVESVPDSPWFVVATQERPRLSVPLEAARQALGSEWAGLGIASCLAAALLWRWRREQQLRAELQSQHWLLESEQRWRKVLTDVPQIAVSLDLKGCLTFANRHFLELTGWTEEELLGRNWFDTFIPADARTEVREIFEETVAQGGLEDRSRHENSILTRKGTLLEVNWFNTLTRDATGVLLEITCLGVDRTESRRAQRALEESEAKFRSIFETLTEGAALHELIWDDSHRQPVDYRVVDVNPAFEEHTGLSATQARGQLGSIVYDLTPAPFLETYASVVRSGKPFAFETYFAPLRRHFAISVCTPRPNWFATVFRDVTNQKEAAQALREQQRQLTTLLANLPGMAYRCANRPDWPMEFASEGCVPLTGWTPEDLTAQRPAYGELILEEDRQAVQKAVQAGIETRSAFEIIHRIRRADGEIRWVRDHGCAVFDANDDLLFLEGFITDVTESREALEARFEALARFSGFAEASQYGMGIANLDGTIVYTNPALAKMLGEPSSEACLGKHFPTAYYAERDARRLEEEGLPTLLREGQWHAELELQTADGRRLPTEENYFVIRDRDGQPRYLANILTDITERKRAEDRMRRRDAILQAVGDTSAQWLTHPDWESTLEDVLGRLGPAADVSRAYLFANRRGPDGEILTSQMHEWSAEGVPSQIDNPKLQSLPVRAAGFGRWEKALKNGGRIAGNVREFPQPEQTLLLEEGIQALVVVPVLVRGNWWGFLGFDECRHERVWSEPEIGALRTAARTLAAAIERQQDHAALEDARNMLERAQTLGRVGSWIADVAPGGSITWSEQTCRIFGVEPAGFDRRVETFLSLVHPEDRDRVFHARQADIAANRPHELEYRILRNGQTRWVRQQAALEHDAAGNPWRLMGMVQDITERLQAERLRAVRLRLLEQAETLSSLQELLQVALGELEYLTESLIGFCHSMKPDQETVALRTWSTRSLKKFSPDGGHERRSPGAEDAILRDCLRLRRAVIQNDPGDGAPPRDPSGNNPVFTRLMLVPVFRGDRVVAVFGLGNKSSDYTEEDIRAVSSLSDLAWEMASRKRTERALRESERRFADAFEFASTGIGLVSLEGCWLQVNRALCELTGYSAAELQQLGLIDLAPPNNRATDQDRLQEMLRGERPVYTAERRLLQKDGRVIWGLLNLSLLRNPEGDPVHFIAQLQDITQRKEAEEALTRERTLLRTLVDHLPLAVFVKDREGRKLLANQRDVETMGLESESEAVGKTDLEVFGAEQAREFMEDDNFVMQTGQPILNREESLDNGTDFPKWSLTSKVPLIDEQGRTTGLIGFSLDISKRKETEERLAESEERFRRAIEELPIPVMLHDDANEVLQISRGWTRFSGYTQDELPTMGDWTERAYGQRSGSEKEYIDRLFEVDDTLDNGEWTINARDGSKRIWAFQSTPLGRLRQGRRVLLSLAVDITDQKAAEKQLLESEDKFTKAFQASAHVITITRLRDGSFVDMNGAFTDYCGYTREEAMASSTVGLNLWVNPEDRNRLLASLKKHGSVLSEECQFRTKNGKILTALYSAHIIQLQGETCVLANLSDITARKQAEESLHQMLEERTALLKEVHHRVKNNLQIVSSLLNLQAARTAQPDQVNALHETGARVRAMALLHETLYRSESLARVDLHGYLERVCAQLFRASDPEVTARVQLRLDVEALELPLDQAVPVGLLIHELVSNALKHGYPDNRTGSIHLSLRTTTQSTGLSSVEIEVANDGLPLEQDFDSNEPNTLGLRLVTSLVGQLDGSMKVCREPRTAFHITFQTEPS